MGSTFNWPGLIGSGVPTFATLAAFPSAVTSGNGALAIALDTNILYESNGTTWLAIAQPGDALTVAAFGNTPNANGLSLSALGALNMQPADATHPGGVSITTQSFSGDKTFLNQLKVQAVDNATKSFSLICPSGTTHPNFRFEPLDTGFLQIENDSGTTVSMVFDYTGKVGIGVAPNGNAELDIRAPANTYGLQLFNPTSLPLDFMLFYDGSNNLLANVDNTGKFFIPGAQISGLTASELVATDASKNLISLAKGNLTDVGTDGITITGGTGAVIGSGTSIAQHVADTTHNGYLSSADWNTFNGKQASGNYITALTGDVTASGPGSSAATLPTVNSNVGSFTFASFTVNAKGLVTAASSGATPLTNPMTTLGDTIYEDATPTPVRLAGNTTSTKKFLTQTGTGTISAPPGWNTIVAGDVPNLAASIITSGQLALARGGTNADLSATGGASQVLKQVSSGAAVTVGQLAFSDISGTAGSTQLNTASFVAPTQQILVSGSAATYTLPTSPRKPLYLKVTMVGGGGGGAGSGTGNGTAAGNGGDTTFSTFTANGGVAGTRGGNGGAPGASSGGSINLSGEGGDPGISATNLAGGRGGRSCFPSSGQVSGGAAAQTAGGTNTGSGGSGGGTGGSGVSGAGGGSGGLCIAWVSSPATTYTYTVGAVGTAGAAGASGFAGTAGGSGIIIVEEFYQ